MPKLQSPGDAPERVVEVWGGGLGCGFGGENGQEI